MSDTSEMDDIGGSTWGLTDSVTIGENGRKNFNVTYTKEDDQEMVDEALARRDIEAAKDAMKTPAAARYKLSGGRDAMTAVIEFARSQATDYECLHSVWAAMEAMTVRPERFPPLLGMSDDGTAVKYRNGTIQGGLFTKKNLKGRMERQEKARKSL